ncbi:MAG: hypothetical protein Q3977_06380 [Oscillospiraceae bacterium]|nr:hypothetical protein [Oscillospiraceae bacterium]
MWKRPAAAEDGSAVRFAWTRERFPNSHFASSQSPLSSGAFKKAPFARSLAPPFRKRLHNLLRVICLVKEENGLWMPQKKKPLHISVRPSVSGVRNMD